MQKSLPPLSLYLHLPWCVRKCPYCDFNSHRAGDQPPFAGYVHALQADIRHEALRAGGRQINSIFLGGGTPSLFGPQYIAEVLDSCRNCLELAGDCEVTMEANPGTVEHGSLKAYRGAGVTRLSIGAQSFNQRMLKTLGRIHGPAEISKTFGEADRAGFDSINLDLMFALPGQDVASARADIEQAAALGPSHLSWYQLTLEPNTVFHQRPPRDLPDDDLAWSIQEAGHALLASRGYEQYEISAFCKAGHECRHNMNYWQFGDYLAAGAGAHGKLSDSDGRVVRYRKPANPVTFMEQAGKAEAPAAAIEVGPDDLAFEFMLNALRLPGGFSADLYRERTGLDIGGLTPQIGQAVADGLLEEFEARAWRPTSTGFRFLNDLQARFLPAGTP